ncbi:MAG: hypothetical protein RML95_04285 [Anaerolineae bacterium]|nr:hypothetical protein [Anaerolineae bacterium]MDW8298535.1 hypothetical protein [Anaerolineae bacterium]
MSLSLTYDLQFFQIAMLVKSALTAQRSQAAPQHIGERLCHLRAESLPLDPHQSHNASTTLS